MRFFYPTPAFDAQRLLFHLLAGGFSYPTPAFTAQRLLFHLLAGGFSYPTLAFASQKLPYYPPNAGLFIYFLLFFTKHKCLYHLC
jgi:hypothetical protein